MFELLLDDLNIEPEEIKHKLIRAGIDTLGKILAFTAIDLSGIIKKSESESQILMEQFASLICPLPIDLNSTLDFISTGDSKLDAFFCGGLKFGTITEIYGPSGVGKTQFALQMLLQTYLLPSQLPASSLYICTRSLLCYKRLEQLAGHLCLKHPSITISQLLENIKVLHLRDLTTQTHLIKYQLPNVVKYENIKLIIIDTIAANFRSSDNDESLDSMERSKAILETLSTLKEIAELNQIAVLLINETTANMNVAMVGDPHISKGTMLPMRKTQFQPCLGYSLTCCVTNRICFYKENNRRMEMQFSPYCPNKSQEFIIQEDGIHGI